ncbi:MAG: AAA family ATPase [Phycisphaerales bacterium]|nr:AAA family ATPase [Phycisphaerales bacterium]
MTKPPPPDDLARFERVIRGRHELISIVTFEEREALHLVNQTAVNLGRAVMLWSASVGVRDALLADGRTTENTQKPADALREFAKWNNRPLCVMLDVAPFLIDAGVRRVMRDTLAAFARTGAQMILIDHTDELPDVIKAYAQSFDLTLPQENELEQIVRRTVRAINREQPLEIKLARKHLDVIVRNLRGLTARQAERVVVDCVASDARLDEDDLAHILAMKRQSLSKAGLLEFVEAPTDLSEIGGLRRLKRWLKQRQDALTREAIAFGIDSPRGVLMLGVQGAGKSLCAKAIATAWERPLLRMDVGALYDRYIGESERRLRDTLAQAEAMSPIVLWIDEIEKAFASAASRSADGGLSQRMFGQLLTWMQEHQAPVFLVATANDIEALPPELMRKGRFDEIFFVDLPNAAVRREIFAIHLRRRHRDPEQVDLALLAEASDGFSGAEIEQAIVSAMHDAFARKKDVTTDAILAALRASAPLSVTMAEKVAWLRKWATKRCVPAD